MKANHSISYINATSFVVATTRIGQCHSTRRKPINVCQSPRVLVNSTKGALAMQ